MNYVDLSIVIFTVLAVYVGFRRGLFISLLTLLRMIVGIPLSIYAGETFNQKIYDKYIKEYAAEQVSHRLSDSKKITDFTSELKETVNAFSFLFKDKTDTDVINSLTPDNAAVYITDNIIEPIALEIVKIVLIILTFLIFYLITGIIISAAKRIREKKSLPLHNTNSVLGGVFGLIKAVIIIFAVGAATDFIAGIQYEDNEFIRQLDSSVILKFINEYNPIVSLWLIE